MTVQSASLHRRALHYGVGAGMTGERILSRPS
jgi:hypothetical protein